jgi:RpiR family transcriptional regulator, carbohydrate utilization regulator
MSEAQPQRLHVVGSEPVLARIRTLLPSLRRSDAAVARAILDSPDGVLKQSVAELAAAAEVSDATVIHCCKKLGFSGFQHLKFELSQALEAEGLVVDRPGRLTKGSPVGDVVGEVVRSTGAAVEDVRATLDLAALDAVVAALDAAGSIVVVGATPSYFVAADVAYRLATIGLPAEAPPGGTAQLLRCGQLGRGDVCLAISHTGATPDSIKPVQAAAKAGATTAAITSFARSALAKSAEHVLVAGGDAVSVRVEAMASRFAHLAVFDAIYVALALRNPRRAAKAQETLADFYSETQL